MRIIRPDRLLKTEAHYFKPNCRYIVSDFECDQLLMQLTDAELRFSSFNSWERRYGGQDLNGKSVCVYRHNAWGDQLIASAIPRYLKTLYPEAKIHMYCHTDVLSLWHGNTFVDGSAIPLPIPFDVAEGYDYHIFYEGMIEGNGEPDQHNCYDDFFGVIGLKDVPDHFKRPCIFPMPGDYKWWNENVPPAILHKRFLVYHMSPDNKNRRYPPEQGIKFLRMFHERYPTMHVIIVGTDKANEYRGMIYAKLHESWCWNLLNQTPNFRSLLPIMERASLVVCPDSAIMHLAACSDHVPVISLWGLFHPQDRIKYYPNSYPVTAFESCPHAPCRDHNFFLPTENCKDATEHRVKERIKHCEALAAIKPEQIMDRVDEILK